MTLTSHTVVPTHLDVTPFRHTLDMCISREEFLRLLPAALGPFELDGATIRGTHRGRRWAISLTPQRDRRLGGIDLPLHRVDITVDDCPWPEADALLKRFRRGFLRGGG